MVRRALLFFLLCAGTILLCGCPREFKLEDPSDLNQGLDYIPWSGVVRDPLGQKPEPNAQENEGDPSSLTILPKMRLNFLSYSLQPREGGNTSLPLPAKYEYVVRDHDFGDEDFFFLSYVLSTARPGGGRDGSESFDPLLAFRGAGSGIPADNFRREIGEKVLKPTFASMRLTVRGHIPELPIKEKCVADTAKVTKGTAAEVRAWINEPSKNNFQEWGSENTRQALKLTLFGGNKALPLSLFDKNSAYFNDNGLTEEKANLKNPFYHDGRVFMGRGVIKVEVPVRIAPEVGPMYFPVYYSVADVENELSMGELSVQVLGLRRDAKFLDAVNVTNLRCEVSGAEKMDKVPEDELRRLAYRRIIAPDHYFTLWFHEAGRSSFGAKGLVKADPSLKGSLLIAPGDVLYIFKTRRGTATKERP